MKPITALKPVGNAAGVGFNKLINFIRALLHG